MKPLLILLLILALQPPQKKPTSAQQPPQTDNRGTEQTPLVVKQLPTPKTEKETAQDTKDREEKERSEKRFTNFNRAIILVGILQLAIFGYQAYQLRKTVNAMQGQSRDMKDSITQATRAAEASEKSAKAAQDNIELVIQKERARLTVELKPLTLDADKSYATIDFLVTAYGATAAYDVRSECAIYCLPLEHISDAENGSAIMFPLYSLPKVVPHSTPVEPYAFLSFSDEDRGMFLTEIGLSRLVVGARGIIKYRDVFDRERETRFRYYWKTSMYGISGNWIPCGTDEENKTT